MMNTEMNREILSMDELDQVNGGFVFIALGAALGTCLGLIVCGAMKMAEEDEDED